MNFDQVSENPQLIDLDGSTHSLDQLYSEQINLVLFYNTNCLGCTGRAIPYGYELSQKYKSVNFIVIHVSLGSRKENVSEIKAVFTEGKPPFPIFLDRDNQLYNQFKCEGTPHWIIADKGGRVLHSIFGSQEGAKLKIELAIEEMYPKFS